MQCIPNVTFKMRVGDETPPEGGCSIGGKFVDVTTKELFAGKRVVVFALPGAFTPTCSSQQLPGYEAAYEAFQEHGIDEIYCVSVNDAFTMNAWAKELGIEDVKMLPDGNGTFTRQMGMLVDKSNLGFGMRSWRYAMVVNDGVIEAWSEEPGREDNAGSDPYGESSPETILKYVLAMQTVNAMGA